MAPGEDIHDNNDYYMICDTARLLPASTSDIADTPAQPHSR